MDFRLQSLLQEQSASSSESPSERDIYMFGVTLLQSVTCPRDIHGDNLHHLIDKVNQEQKLNGSKEREGVETVVKIALQCMQNQPFFRPSIGEAVKVHTFKKARAAVYPSAVQHGIVWFWPNTDPQFKDIFTKKRPPYIPELDDLSYTKSMGARDFPFGYEILMENVMDPAHVAYAHYGIVQIPQAKDRPKADREGGTPIEISVKRSALDGFDAERELARSKFIPPCLYYTCLDFPAYQSNESVSSGLTKEEPSSHMSPKRALLILICVPVSPGNSRLIWTFPRNFGLWTDHIIPRWMLHMSQNLILDSDLYLLHLEERKIMKAGPSNWHKACFVPTKSDAHIVAFRAWLRKYSGGQLDWGTNFSSALPPTPPREQLMERYWSHVVNCSSCSVAYKGLQVLEVVLQIFSIALIGIPVINHGVMSVAARITAVSMAILCFAASRWLSYFIYKTFHFHDYTHAFC